MSARMESSSPLLLASRPARAFTLVELLVVIAIIGVLAALIASVAPGVIANANQTKVLLEVSQLATALKTYNSDYGSYPPNFTNPDQVARHCRKRWPRIATEEIQEIVALDLTPAQALVFWLRGFSPDPVHPYLGMGDRTPMFEFDKSRLAIYVPGQAPQAIADLANVADALYPDLDPSVSPEPKHIGQTGIPVPSYFPPKIEGQPYIYFSAKSYVVYGGSGPGQTTFEAVPGSVYVKPLKSQLDPSNDISKHQFVEPENFQLLCAGLDGSWYNPTDYQQNPFDLLLYPQGPFTGELADTLTNFSTNNLEDSQP